MSKTQEVFWGSAYYFIGAVIAAGVAYLTKLLLVRVLTVEEYGLFFAVFTFVMFFGVFKSLGLEQGLARFIAEYNSKKEYGKIKSIVFGSAIIQICTSLLVVGLMWVFSDYLAVTYFGDEQAKWLLRILSFYLPLSIILGNTRAILNGLKMTKWLASINLVQNSLVFFIIVFTLSIGIGLYAPVAGYLISLVLFLLIFLVPITRNHSFYRFKFNNFYSENKRLLLFSLPLILTGAGALIINYFDTLMITYFDTVVEVGVYNIVYPTAMLLTLLGGSIGLILLPVLTELWVKKKKNEIVSAFKIIYKYLFVLYVPATLVLMIFSSDLIRIFFGEEYLLGVVAFNILLFGSLFKTLLMINNQVLIVTKDPGKIMNLYILGAISNVILNLILIPLYSVTGAAIATAISFLLMAALSLYYTRKKVEIIFPVKSMVLVLFASAIIPLLGYSARLISGFNIYLVTISGLVLGGLIYLLILFVVKVINIKELLEMVR